MIEYCNISLTLFCNASISTVFLEQLKLWELCFLVGTCTYSLQRQEYPAGIGLIQELLVYHYVTRCCCYVVVWALPRCDVACCCRRVWREPGQLRLQATSMQRQTGSPTPNNCSCCYKVTGLQELANGLASWCQVVSIPHSVFCSVIN